MIYRHYLPLVLIILSLCLSACSASNSDLMKNDSNQKQVNVIVLMPVEDKTNDARIQKLLIARLLEELRYKGYSQVAVTARERLSTSLKSERPEGTTDQPLSQNNVNTSEADAAMYCTLHESKSSATFFYSPASVALRCELRSMKTGETIWNAGHRSISRRFNMINSALQSNGALESALEEVVGKVMETLPYGPMLRG